MTARKDETIPAAARRCDSCGEEERIPGDGIIHQPGCTPTAAKPDESRLHGKYHGLRRTKDDSEVEGWYFVIRENDEAGKAALLAYADACEDYAPELAADLRRHVHEERLMDGLYEAGWDR